MWWEKEKAKCENEFENETWKIPTLKTNMWERSEGKEIIYKKPDLSFHMLSFWLQDFRFSFS